MPFITQPLDIWTAAERGMLDDVKRFVAAGTPVDAKGRGDITALHKAAQAGHFEVVAWLLDNGANVNARTIPEPGNPGAETPLYLAAERGNIDVVEFLLKRGANPDLKSSDGTSPLAKAAESGNVRLVSVLVDNGAKLNPRGNFSP